jgi:NADPH:quinone reductase-like Zn-dependent oxidoreductase
MLTHQTVLLLLACLTSTCALTDIHQIAIDDAGGNVEVEHDAGGNVEVEAVVSKKQPVLCEGSEKCLPYLERVLEVKKYPYKMKPGMAMATIRVKAAAANQLDWKRFVLPSLSPPKTAFGFDMAGIVVEKAKGCNLKIGDAVYGSAFPAFSTYVKVDCEYVGEKSNKLNFTEAAALPVSALTSLEAFHKTGAPWTKKPNVLVIGGSSGAGHFGIQLAKALGAGNVYTTASKKNFDFVKGLGADRVIDYQTQKWWSVLPKGAVDIIYDTVGLPGAAVHAYDVLAENGKYITEFGTLARQEVALSRSDVTQTKFIMQQNSKFYLDELTDLVNKGLLKPKIHNTYTGLASVPKMLTDLMNGHVAGKLVVTI